MALGMVGMDKIGRQVSLVYCDNCAAERLYPMLHDTLYRVGESAVYLCEIHAILAKRREETPGFAIALEEAKKKMEEARVARLDTFVKTPADGGSGGVSTPEEQPGRVEDRADKQDNSME